ncbi:MAG: nuclear transport factor 2 family protein, partial [Planctomycetota bacterium]|nr:nuclear transport factor 2 family protein [Planctomycetota bacterium]
IQNHLMFMPQLFENFSVEPIEMINDGNKVFVRASVKATGMEFEAGHFFVIEDEKIAEFYVYDDSQKMAHTMKAI